MCGDTAGGMEQFPPGTLLSDLVCVCVCVCVCAWIEKSQLVAVSHWSQNKTKNSLILQRIFMSFHHGEDGVTLEERIKKRESWTFWNTERTLSRVPEGILFKKKIWCLSECVRSRKTGTNTWMATIQNYKSRRLCSSQEGWFPLAGAGLSLKDAVPPAAQWHWLTFCLLLPSLRVLIPAVTHILYLIPPLQYRRT